MLLDDIVEVFKIVLDRDKNDLSSVFMTIKFILYDNTVIKFYLLHQSIFSN